MWYQCQLVLDDHLQACPACDSLESGAYCGACGERLSPEMQRCEICQMTGTTAYCVQCGSPLVSAVGEAIDADTFDWDTWKQRLQPFLGGLTPQELRLLAQD